MRLAKPSYLQIPAIMSYVCMCVQVDFLKMLYDKMVMLHQQYADSPRGINFPRPSFKASQRAARWCCQWLLPNTEDKEFSWAAVQSG